MRPFIVYDSIEVYLAPVPEGEQPRHERERAAVGEMVRGLFGEEAVIAHDEWGAPCLEGRQESISVSHSRTTAAIAIDRLGRAVGIDIEGERPQLQRVAPRVLSETEMAAYGASLRTLARAWTLKEAAYKCAGIPGLDFRRDISLPLPPTEGVEVYAGGRKLTIAFCGPTGEEVLSLVYLK